MTNPPPCVGFAARLLGP